MSSFSAEQESNGKIEQLKERQLRLFIQTVLADPVLFENLQNALKASGCWISEEQAKKMITDLQVVEVKHV